MAIDHPLQNCPVVVKWATTNDASIGIIKDQFLSTRHSGTLHYQIVGKYLRGMRLIVSLSLRHRVHVLTAEFLIAYASTYRRIPLLNLRNRTSVLLQYGLNFEVKNYTV